MIELAADAIIRCDAPGCINKQPGRLVLMTSGTFGVVPQSLSWQLAAAPNGAYLARCPEHRVVMEPPKPEAPEATP